MSNRAEHNRERRWHRKVLVDHQAQTRAAHEMAKMSRMMDVTRGICDALVAGVMASMWCGFGGARRRWDGEEQQKGGA